MPKLSLYITSSNLQNKQALSASRDVIISGQICGSKFQRVFTLGDGCWLSIKTLRRSDSLSRSRFGYAATRSSIFYRIIRAGIGVFSLSGLKIRVINYPFPSSNHPKNGNRDTIRHYMIAIPAVIYRSAQGPGPESAHGGLF